MVQTKQYRSKLCTNKIWKKLPQQVSMERLTAERLGNCWGCFTRVSLRKHPGVSQMARFSQTGRGSKEQAHYIKTFLKIHRQRVIIPFWKTAPGAGGLVLQREHFVFYSTSALLTDERGELGAGGTSWTEGESHGPVPVLRLPTEKIGEHTSNHRFLSINVSYQNMAMWCSASSLHSGHQASVATSTNWHFSVICLLWFLDAIPSFTVSLLLFKINLTIHSVLFSLMLTPKSTENSW